MKLRVFCVPVVTPLEKKQCGETIQGMLAVSCVRVRTLQSTVNRIIKSGGKFRRWLPRLKNKREEIDKKINELKNAQSAIETAIRLLEFD